MNIFDVYETIDDVAHKVLVIVKQDSKTMLYPDRDCDDEGVLTETPLTDALDSAVFDWIVSLVDPLAADRVVSLSPPPMFSVDAGLSVGGEAVSLSVYRTMLVDSIQRLPTVDSAVLDGGRLVITHKDSAPSYSASEELLTSWSVQGLPDNWSIVERELG